MPLNHLYIPAQNPATAEHLTLIHGWAAESRIWEDWARTYFSAQFSITLIDLPGFGLSNALPNTSNSEQLTRMWVDALVAVMPENSHLIGWSLGGLLAQQIAWRYPERVNRLICLASTPRFTQNQGWQRSVSPKIIGDFIYAISQEANGVLTRFWRMQLQGVPGSKTLMKQLLAHMSHRHVPNIRALNQGLVLLRDMDNRDFLKQLTQPTLWILGEKDPLIPQDIRENLHQLQPQAKIVVQADGSHIAFFSQPEQTAQLILDFLENR